MEEGLRWIEDGRTTPIEAVGGGEPEVETTGGGFQPGQERAKGCTGKKALTPGGKRNWVEVLQIRNPTNLRRCCDVIQLARFTRYYCWVADDQAFLRIRIKELSGVRMGWGYRRIHLLFQREGWRPKRHVSSVKRVVRPLAETLNHSWSMDFMADTLFESQKLRLLTIVDNFSRESLAIEAGYRLRGEQVVSVLSRLIRERGMPQSIWVDNCTEFTSRAMDQWAYWNNVHLGFSRPGKLTDNAVIESFNGRLRQECLNQNWFQGCRTLRGN